MSTTAPSPDYNHRLNVLIEESYSRFDSLLTDPDKIVSVDTLGQISAWLVEVYTARPTEGPEVSSTGA